MMQQMVILSEKWYWKIANFYRMVAISSHAVPMIRLKDKSNLIHAVILHKVLLSVMAEMNQFKSGVDSAGLGVQESKNTMIYVRLVLLL